MQLYDTFSSMNASRPPVIRQISISPKAIETMLETMREFGSHGWEVLVLWLGEVNELEGKARVVNVFVPKQKPISSEDGIGYFVDSQALFHLNRTLSESGLRLIAQVHSHPHEAYHSEADDRYAIITEDGGLSIVVPEFGKIVPDPALWAVYRLNGRDWNEIGKAEARGLFAVGIE